jgi:hypothetical protein
MQNAENIHHGDTEGTERKRRRKSMFEFLSVPSVSPS